MCSTCGQQSVTFDPYMAWSAPLPQGNDMELDVNFVPNPMDLVTAAGVDGSAAVPSFAVTRLRITLPKHATLLHVKQRVASEYECVVFM